MRESGGQRETGFQPPVELFKKERVAIPATSEALDILAQTLKRTILDTRRGMDELQTDRQNLKQEFSETREQMPTKDFVGAFDKNYEFGRLSEKKKNQYEQAWGSLPMDIPALPQTLVAKFPEVQQVIDLVNQLGKSAAIKKEYFQKPVALFFRIKDADYILKTIIRKYSL